MSLFPQIRRLLKHSAVYGLGHMLSRVVTFLMLPYFTHYLTPEDYGAMTLLYTFISLAVIFYIYGFDFAFVRYYILEKDHERRRAILGTIFLPTLLTSSLFTLIVYVTSRALTGVVFDNPEALGSQSQYLLYLAAGILFADTLGAYPYLYFRAVEKSLPFISLKLLGILVHVALTVLFLSVFQRGIAGIFEANLISSLLQLLLLLPVLIKNVKFTFSFKDFFEYLRFGFPNIPSQFFTMIVELADRKVIELLLGIGIVGIYSAGYKLGMLMAVITMGFRFAWHPFFLSIADRPDAKETYARIFTYYLAVTGSLFLLFAFTVEPLMKMSLPIVGTLIEERYWAGLKVVPFILLAHLCNGANANFMVGVMLKKKTYLLPITNGAAAFVNVGANLLLIPIFGMMVAAWMTLISYFTAAVLLYWLIRKHYPIPYEWGRIGKLLLCSGGIFFISLLPFWEPFWILKLLLLPIFFISLKGLGFFLPEEIAALKRRLFPART